MSADEIDQQTVDAWRADGAICLRGVFAAEWIELLESGFRQSLAAPGALAKDYAAQDQGSFFTDHAMHRRIDPIRRFVSGSPAAEIAALLMGAKKVNLVDDHLLIKEPGTANPTYWHQDQPYYPFTGQQFCSLWIPLDAATRETGTMRFVRGSHRWGAEFRPVRIGLGEPALEAEVMDGPVPDIDADPDKYQTLWWDLQPGDCLAFHGLMVHGAWPNASKTARRRALSMRLAGDDIRWHPRPYAPTEPDPPDLEPGGPIDCAHYPALWPAA